MLLTWRPESENYLDRFGELPPTHHYQKLPHLCDGTSPTQLSWTEDLGNLGLRSGLERRQPIFISSWHCSARLRKSGGYIFSCIGNECSRRHYFNLYNLSRNLTWSWCRKKQNYLVQTSTIFSLTVFIPNRLTQQWVLRLLYYTAMGSLSLKDFVYNILSTIKYYKLSMSIKLFHCIWYLYLSVSKGHHSRNHCLLCSLVLPLCI